MKKSLSPFFRIHSVVALIFLCSQISSFSNPVFAADPILDSATGTPTATVSATTQTSTPTSTQTQTTSTEFLSQQTTLSTATTTPSDTTISPSTTLTAADVTKLPQTRTNDVTTAYPMPEITRVAPGDSIASVSGGSDGDVTLHYETKSGGWAGGGLTFDRFASSFIETTDLSGFNQLVVGLKGNPSQVKFEIVDDQDHKASVHLTGIRSDKEQFWAISTSSLQGINLAKTRLLYFIVEGVNQTGDLSINFDINPTLFGPVNPSTTLTTVDITNLPGNLDITRVGPEGNPSGVWETSRGVTLQYDTTVGGWAGGGFTYDSFSTLSTSIETGDLSGFKQLVFGLKSLKGTTDRVKLELVDDKDRKASIHLTGIRSDMEQVWAIPVSSIQGIDYTKVSLIYFIVEGANQTGQLEINRISIPSTPSPPVPAGWMRATSNVNFAWKIESYEKTIYYYDGPRTFTAYVYSLQDLRTGTIQRLGEGSSDPSKLGQIDVSGETTPGGPVVIYRLADYLTSSEGFYNTFIQRVSDSTKQIKIQEQFPTANGIPQSLQFNSDNTLATLKTLSSFSDGTRIETIYQIALNTLTTSNPTARLVAQGTNLHIDSDTPLVILPIQLATLAIKAFVWDSSKGLDQMSVMTPLFFDTKVLSRLSFKLVDAYTTLQGRQIVSVSADYAIEIDPITPIRRTIIQDAKTGQALSLTDVAIAVTYNQNLATYTLLQPNGTTTQKTIDLETLQIGSSHPSPDGNYTLIQVGGSFILTDKSGKELGRIRVAGGLAHLNGFTVTNQAVYFAGESRSNLYFQFCFFSNFTQSGIQQVKLPKGVTVLGAGTVQFIQGMPGVAEITGSDLVIRRVDLEKGVILFVGPNTFAITSAFYQGSLPPDAFFAESDVRDASGLLMGADITVHLNQSKTSGVLQNQFMKIRQVAGQWIVTEVLDRDYQDKLIAKNSFTYNANAQLQKITRTNKAGALLSTIHVRRPAGKAPYYEIVTALGLKENLNLTTPLFKVLKKAAALEAQKPAPPPPAPVKPPSPSDLLKNLQNQLVNNLSNKLR